MIGYIYKTTNNINGKIYIGQHKSKVFDESYKGSGVRLWEAINKYGWNNFSTEIIEECFNKDEMNEREKFWIKEFNSRDVNIGYNLSEGGEKSFYLTKESYKKIVETRRKNGTISGWKKSEESVQKTLNTKFEKYGKSSISGMEGKHHSEETKKKMSQAAKGRSIPDDLKRRISETTKRTCGSEEHRKILSDIVKKKWQDPEYREKMKNRKKTRSCKNICNFKSKKCCIKK